MNLFLKRSPHQQRVDDFMVKAGQDVPLQVTIPDPKTRIFRAKMILEETLETIAALGVGIKVKPGTNLLEMDACELTTNGQPPPDMAEVVDGCCDIKVVTTGTLSAIGVPDEMVQTLVDQNNLLKFGPGSYVRDDGKFMKPPGHKPPDVELFLSELRHAQQQGDVAKT